MSVIPLINNGMMGSVELPPSQLVTTCGTNTESDHNSERDIFQYGAYTKAPKLMPDNIDYSSRRQVLPCKGIIHHVLRREALPESGSVHATALPSRHLPYGLSSLPDKPQNLPILRMSDPNNSQANNPLGMPR